MGDIEVQREPVEEGWNLEEVLQVVRGIRHRRGRDPRELDRGELLRTQVASPYERYSPRVHVGPHEKRQEDHREEWSEDRRLVHGFLVRDRCLRVDGHETMVDLADA